MNVGRLIEALEDYGEHLEVYVETEGWTEQVIDLSVSSDSLINEGESFVALLMANDH